VNIDPGEATFGEIALRVERWSARQGIDRKHLTLSAEWDPIIDQAVLRLVRRVATLDGPQVQRYPATWWDALKADEVRRSPIMRWWVRRHPIAYREIRTVAFLPNCPIPEDYKRDAGYYLSGVD